MNLNGEHIEMSRSWRNATRRAYRRNRRKGWGPITARTMLCTELARSTDVAGY